MAQIAEQLSPPTLAWRDSGEHVLVEGMQIFVQQRGAGDTVVLLHGYPTSSFDWRGIAERLATDHRVIAPDFPGFGLSDKPEAYSYSLFQQADVIETLLGTLGVEAAHIVSHDMGTSVHSELLARERERRLPFQIRSSTFLNGSMLQWMAKITPFQEMLATNERLPEAIEFCRGGFEIYVPALRQLMKNPEAVGDEDATVMYELLRYQDGHTRLPALGGYMRERYIHRDRWLGALEGPAGPVQFVWADGDPIAHIEMGRELHRLYPTHRYRELDGLGHFLLMEDPPRVADAIRDFIRPS
jgi:pimeloyl-ACP methyl ester carboxylesterase